ncbi:restriction endonuclease subunit S [Campylobacter devanensis]|uniref:restriction endonuclease subunit S n=1 Tax=Campylobacter devanensis TaxID=3161138 RepID=UPI0015D8F130|nr:restriction endonuclease subunit S [Campylobacter sp. P155]
MAKIKKDTNLRKSILQAAITGQLISNVEGETKTGKELLDKIIEERNAKLLADWEEAKKKNPKAKKPAPIVASEITEDEIPFEIPKSWCWCRLGDLIQIKSGDGLTSTQMKDGSIPVYGGNGITGYHNDANIHEETIVIGRVGFYCGSVHLTEKEAWVTDNAFISNYSKNYLNRNYLITVLRQLDLGKQQNKTAQPVVSGKKIYPMLFPLPPLAVQNAIVAKLEEVLPLVDAYENAVLQKEELKTALPDKVKKAILQEAIQGKLTKSWRKTTTIEESGKQLLDKIIEERNAKLLAQWEEAKKKNPKAKKPAPIAASEITEDEIPFEIPKSWCWCRLGEIGVFNGGYAFKSEKYVTKGNGIRVLRISDFNEAGINHKNPVYYPYNEELTPYKLNDNDIIMCMTGGTVGKSFLIKTLLEDMYVNQRVADIKILHPINSEYVYSVIQSHHIQKGIQDNKNSTNDNISAELIKNFLIPLPPLAEQEKIVEIIEQMLPLCEKLGG